MRSVRQKNTKPEITVRRLAHRLGLRFRVNRKDLPGTPDIVFPKYHTVIFVHGCFWHRHPECKRATTPKTRVEFWQEKFEKNQERDARKIAHLKDLGWRVEVIWECETENKAALEERLRSIFTLPCRVLPQCEP
ncbi:MAG: DNA mismatch endonuclease Vsr [Gammaproteobacteria bacterium]|nr:DNA mismatch endonuclease Vsr [Gammaproteobacteria bacterium]